MFAELSLLLPSYTLSLQFYLFKEFSGTSPTNLNDCAYHFSRNSGFLIWFCTVPLFAVVSERFLNSRF